MNVKLFRLNSGEEILSRFTDNETSYTLKDPAILIPMERGQIGLMPWLMYTEAAKGVTIPKSFIAFTVDPVEELKNQYDAALNKGIVAPSGSLDSKPKSKLKLTVD
jgi:hypothetical protein